MHIIIRSRLWLFPGVLGENQLHRRLRSEVEADCAREEERKARKLGKDDPTALRFRMTAFLRK